MTDDRRIPGEWSRAEDPNFQLIMALLFLLVVAGGIIDLILDEPETLLSGHVLFELGMITLSLGAAWYLGAGWFRALTLARELQSAVHRHQEERDAWKEKAGHLLEGLGEAMSAQLEAWKLTPTEQATAVMLLKGHSHKRIARLTSRSERTVRQHAVSVYRKSGLAGRAELSGFFLGDLLLPEDRQSSAVTKEADRTTDD